MFYDGRPFPMNVAGEILDPVRAAELALVEAELHDDKMIAQLHYMVGIYARGRDYTNFIIAGGYAAYIAVWTGVAQDIPALYRLFSGGLIAISLLAFLSWELVKMVHLMKEGHIIAAALETPGTRADLASAVQDARNWLEVREVGLHAMWPFAFYISVITGLVGGALLAIAALSSGGFLLMS
jgi:hypothetical protein